MKNEIISAIKSLVLEDNENWSRLTNDRYFDEPLVGFASANDVLFTEYKTIIGDAHLTPKEAFEAMTGSGSFPGGTTISIVLPINEKLRKSNRAQKLRPSDEWIGYRAFEAGIFLKKISLAVEGLLRDMGCKAVTPAFSDIFKTLVNKNNIYSNWSERHVAYAAGLGTFSLNDGFITEKGIAIQLVSLVTDLDIEPDVRVARDFNYNCLYCRNGTCGVCIKRCPVGAITTNGHDKMKCNAHVYGEESKKYAALHGGDANIGSGCAFCFTKVPCEFKIPRGEPSQHL